jgi:membrane associated rhomboid family serine protease
MLPPRPPGGTYGYFAKDGPRECSRDDFPSAARGLVWTPDHERSALDTEVPILAGVVRARLRASFRQSVLWLIYGALIASTPLFLGLRFSAAPLVLLVLPAVQSVIDTLSEQRALARRQQGTEAWFPDDASRFALWVAWRRPVVSWIAGAGIAVVGVAQLVAGLDASVVAAGLVKDAVRRGEVWRVLTGTMLHGNIWHFFGNGGALLALGPVTEALAGRGRAAVVLLASLLTGSVFSLVLLPGTNSVGASGGLMGLLGFLIVTGHRHRPELPRGFVRSLVKGVLWVGAAGLLAYAYIDNAAHAGGLLAGLAAGWALAPGDAALPLGEGRRWRIAGVAGALAIGAVALASAAVILAA